MLESVPSSWVLPVLADNDEEIFTSQMANDEPEMQSRDQIAAK